MFRNEKSRKWAMIIMAIVCFLLWTIIFVRCQVALKQAAEPVYEYQDNWDLDTDIE